MDKSKRKEFGLNLAGIGAIFTVISLIESSLSLGFLIGSVILVVVGIILYFFKRD